MKQHPDAPSRVCLRCGKHQHDILGPRCYGDLSATATGVVDLVKYELERVKLEVARFRALHPATPCCDYQAPADLPYPVYWNPFNGVVQCHNCGHVYKPSKATQES